VLYDEIIPRLFDSSTSWTRSSRRGDEVELIKMPPSGYYEVTAAKDKLSEWVTVPSRTRSVPKSFHLDTYCFDSGSENTLFWDLFAKSA